MELHAVPQNIMQVEFQLFGDLTIREFSYIAGGGLLAFMVYAINPPFLFKWPFIIMFVLGGIALAKGKYNERSMDVYLITFMNALTSSQKMVWKKGSKKSDILADSKTKSVTYQVTKNPLQADEHTAGGVGVVKAFQQMNLDVDSADSALENRVNTLFDSMYAGTYGDLPKGAGMQFAPKKEDERLTKLKPLSAYSSYNALDLTNSGKTMLVMYLSGRQVGTTKSKAGVYRDVVGDDLEKTQSE
ncbi:PrgI family protein, partial [Candidatus Dojkabacteria bacterium]|nr:PrgI family protein [Candidatus Dojkabacteria bacterium]